MNNHMNIECMKKQGYNSEGLKGEFSPFIFNKKVMEKMDSIERES